MVAQPESSTHEVLAGYVERVTYHNAENGFCVLRAKARGHRDVVTVVGHAATISAGEWITASGEWVNDRTHGQQFRARFLRTSPPTSADGIEKYLSSGMIRGIGQAYAKKLVRSFGEKVFDVIEASPERLREVDGMRKSRNPVRDASERDDGTFSRRDFRWDKRRGVYICPNNKVLHTTGTVHDGTMLRYRASKLDCDVCPLKMQCCPNMIARQVPRDVHEDARELARRLMGTKRFLKSRDERKRVEMRSPISRPITDSNA